MPKCSSLATIHFKSIRPLAPILALSLNPSPRIGRGTFRLPFPQNWGQGVGGWGRIWIHAGALLLSVTFEYAF